jgi:glycosyltransferase involved in cell wall biosynthesis
VPQHVISQTKCAEVGFINIKNVEIEELKRCPGTQMDFVKQFDVRRLPVPFNNPDIVVFHECYRPEYLKISKNLRKNKVPYVDIPHGELRIEAQQKKHIKKVIANFLLFNNFINKSIAVQCLSEGELEATHFGKKKFIVTNGVSMPSKQKDAFSEDSVKFIYIGRYEWKVKGLDLLFEAISKKADFLRQNHCSFELYGPDIFGRLLQVAKLVKDNQIEDLVTLNHEITGEEKKKKLLASDIFIQTSRHEGMPMGILEAMSYGLPCLVTEGTNLGNEIQDRRCGWVANTCVESIGEQLVRSISERSRWMDMGENAQKMVFDKYNWDVIAKQATEKYKMLVSGLNNVF